MILVNGTEGIGTDGVHQFLAIIQKILLQISERKMENEKLHNMTPWYKNFKGTITKLMTVHTNVKVVM